MASRRQTGRQSDAISGPLERVSKVLELVANSPQGLRASEIADRLGLPQPTAYRLVRRLEKIGYLACSSEGLEYSIGPELRDLARTIQADRPVELIIEAVIQDLADSTGMSAYLAARAGNRLMLVATRPPSMAEGPSIIPGHRFPVHATAAGKAILAFQSDEVVEDFLRQAQLKRYSKRTITTPKRFLDELAKVRKSGFATMKGELGNNLWALATPVPADPYSEFAVGIVTFDSAVGTGGEDLSKLAQVVQEAARDLRSVLHTAKPGYQRR